MIKSKERDSGGFNQNAEETTAREDDNNAVAPQVKNPLLNTLFAGKYLIMEVLGEGGMSVVYLARHEAMNKLVAIKTLHVHLMSKTSSLMRFKQEAQAASRLQHPGIVAMHDFGVTDDGTPYLVMDYVNGESLGDLLHKIKSLPVGDALEIFKQTASAISHAHQRGIVHRDIKPSNIMLNFDEHHDVQVKIVDFGVAKDVANEDATKLTQTGESIGSPLYMSPEQCQGQQLDARSDIYSFGCVMYETITGTPAVSADGVLKTMMKHIHDMPPGFKEVRPDLNKLDALERIVFKALAKDPAKRYQKIDDMLTDLNSLHEDRSFAQKLIHKFELTGLRKTTKSINAMVASSLCVGALILFGANFVLSTVASVTTAPSLKAEEPIWSAYKDRERVRMEGSEDKQAALDSLKNLVLEADDIATRKLNPNKLNSKLLQTEFERREKATGERKLHNYDQAKTDFNASIEYMEKFLRQTKDIQHANTVNNLMLAYLGRGDCEYFDSHPDYKAAAADYGRAMDLFREVRANGYWTDITPTEQIEFMVRHADCFFMQGQYDEAKGQRPVISDLTRRSQRDLKDAIYKALTTSKIAEEDFRLNRVEDARIGYSTALDLWRKMGDAYLNEQTIAAGRLAELKDTVSQDGAGDYYSQFASLAEVLARTSPEKMHTKFFSDVFQSYANYLWRHNEFAKAMDMHKQSVKLAERFGE